VASALWERTQHAPQEATLSFRKGHQGRLTLSPVGQLPQQLYLTCNTKYILSRLQGHSLSPVPLSQGLTILLSAAVHQADL
jgi:hypothetical protein